MKGMKCKLKWECLWQPDSAREVFLYPKIINQWITRGAKVSKLQHFTFPWSADVGFLHKQFISAEEAFAWAERWAERKNTYPSDKMKCKLKWECVRIYYPLPILNQWICPSLLGWAIYAKVTKEQGSWYAELMVNQVFPKRTTKRFSSAQNAFEWAENQLVES